MSIHFLDWCRWFIIAQAGFVGAIHQETNPRLWHIVTISASYTGAVVYVAISTVERFGQPLGWRLPLAAFVFIAGDAGLCFMLTHLYSRRVYAKAVRDRLIREEIKTTQANTEATEKNTKALAQQKPPTPAPVIVKNTPDDPANTKNIN